MNVTDLRRRLHSSDPAMQAAETDVDQLATERPELLRPMAPGRSSTLIPRLKGSGAIPRPRLGGDVSSHTPLPNDLPLPAAYSQDDAARLRTENTELRALIEQAIVQEEENERRVQTSQAREAELTRRVRNLEEQVHLLQTGAGDAGDLIVRLQERDDSVNTLTEQVRQLEAHLQYIQENGGNSGDIEQYAQAIRERDQLLEEMTARTAELEQQIASIPPPPPTDEELAKMADELERERCQMNQLRKELEDEQARHAEDELEFEKQMRDMEVQMSKERADMARQRTELQRLQSELRSDVEAAQRGDPLRDRLANLQQRKPEPTAPPVDSRQARDNNFMSKLFGKK